MEEVVAEERGVNLSKLHSLEELKNIRDSHVIWQNPLLVACASNVLSFEDFKYLFSQYYFYSKNFTKLLAAAMTTCDSDFYRAKLSQNLWEEGGGANINQRHSEIFRNFLINCLHVNFDNLVFERYAEDFFNHYLSLCLNSNSVECAAVLSFGTESIVSRLYTIMKKGLLHVGLKEAELEFFNIHIACDDEHALTLEEMALSYSQEPFWFEQCKHAIIKALDLRDIFFKNIYQALQACKLQSLVERISRCSATLGELDTKKLFYRLNEVRHHLYSNQDLEKNINFTVDRVPFEGEVLDPRIVRIPPAFRNEYHRHAHETVFLILSGIGEVIIDGNSIEIKSGDLVFVPRWFNHQTINKGKEDLVFFAVTDYGLTKRLPQNSEKIYRLRQ